MNQLFFYSLQVLNVFRNYNTNTDNLNSFKFDWVYWVATFSGFEIIVTHWIGDAQATI